MAVISTENHVLGNVVKKELWPEKAYCRTVVVMNDAAADLKIGTVLGKVTADGTYKVCEATAVDGSEVAAAVLMQDVTLPATTNTNVLALTRGPAAVSFGGLVFGASINTDGEKLTARNQLEAKGIEVLTTV